MKVGLMVTCLVDTMRPRVGFAALQLLEKAGCEVVVPETQTCCGQPGYNSGDREGAKRLALKVVSEFESCDYVVVPSGSCSGMLRTHYPELFEDMPAVLARIKRLSEKTFELTDFLVKVMKLETIPGNFTGTVTYHDSCSGLREMGVKTQPRALMAKMPGVMVKEMDECESCCGFGGTFSVKYGEISTAIADRKCNHIQKAGTGCVVMGDLGCMLNIEGRLRRRGDTETQVLHIAELLAFNTGD